MNGDDLGRKWTDFGIKSEFGMYFCNHMLLLAVSVFIYELQNDGFELWWIK